MPGLLNIVYNKANVCVVIMDNSVVAMTGHQPTPGSGKTAMGTDAKIIRIQDIAKGVGIEKIEVIDPYDLKSCNRQNQRNIRLPRTISHYFSATMSTFN